MRQVAVVRQELDIGSIHLDTTGSLLLQVLLATERREAPVLRDDDLLPARELVLGTSESLESHSAVGVASAHAHDDLTDIDTGDSSIWLAPGTTHAGLQTIGTSARQHLVDADDVVRVGADAQMETFLSGGLDEVLVGANASGFQSLRAQLLILVGDEVDAQREVIDSSTLSAKIEDSNLGVGHTTVEARLGVRLVLAVAVAASRTAGHFDGAVIRRSPGRELRCR